MRYDEVHRMHYNTVITKGYSETHQMQCKQIRTLYSLQNVYLRG